MTPAQRRSAASKKAARSRKRMTEARTEPKREAKPPCKADLIFKLCSTTSLSRAEIAEAVGCKPDYVRAVWQRKTYAPENNPDRKYIERKRQDPEWLEQDRARRREYARRYYQRMRQDSDWLDRSRARNREAMRELYYRRKAERELADA